RDLGSLNGNSFDFQAYDASVYRRFEEWQEGARNLVRSQVMSNTFKPDAEAWMDQPLEAGRVVPIRDTISSLGYRPWQFQHYSQWP
ncbi:MAG TPA: hypothetical protein VGP94_09480, partial [Tepidisphaeraceae bacterium]|nr:hypothetical protein [Tepidisphaeraceae bacterium]